KRFLLFREWRKHASTAAPRTHHAFRYNFLQRLRRRGRRVLPPGYVVGYVFARSRLRYHVVTQPIQSQACTTPGSSACTCYPLRPRPGVLGYVLTARSRLSCHSSLS
ncbi:unnamed protein product, partial [Laminaria digitata]